MVACNKLHNRI